MFLYLLSSESSLDELHGDGEDEYRRRFLFLFFLLLDRCCFLDFFDRLFDEGILSSSVLLSLEDLLRLSGLFLTLGETSLLLRPCSLLDLIREGLFLPSLEPLSLPNIMPDLCLKEDRRLGSSLI